MKTVIVIYEGAADVPLDLLEGRTPLQVARCVHANALAEHGQCGLLGSVQDGLDARTEVLLGVLAGLSMDQALALQRGPLEALSLGDRLPPSEFSFRGNLVTLDDHTLTDCLVSGLSAEETQTLADALQEPWNPEAVRFMPTAPGCLAVLLNDVGQRVPTGYPPCLMRGERADSFLPGGREGELVRSITEKASDVLAGHAVNEVRVDLGENPANGLWLWGGGPSRTAGTEVAVGRGAMAILSQSRLAMGLAQLAGMRFVHLHLPWREALSEAVFKVAPLVETLQEVDSLLVYIEAPDELGCYGKPADKVRALERMDQYLLGPLMSVLDAYKPYRLVLASDGVVSSENHHPTSGNVPMVLGGEGISPDQAHRWDEQACALGTLGPVKPSHVRELLLKA